MRLIFKYLVLKRIIYIFIIYFSIFNISLLAQDQGFVLKGKIYDGEGPLTGAVILCLHGGKEGPEYAVSDSKGLFTLKLRTLPYETDSVKVSMLGYATKILPVERAGNMDIMMKVEAMQINEITVRAPKVKMAGDTIKFNVQSFAELQDKSISDVLKRIPGIEVRKDGSIYYNGESIENLYIEGMDMLGGRYSLLTENLSAKDIKTVEVMERHQPIRALAEMGTKTKPAINLSLRDRSRGKWIGTAKIAGGVTTKPEALWDGNLFLMRVAPKWNSINNIKANNTGEDLSKELQIKSISNNRPIKVKSNEFISVSTSNAPLDERRVRFNNTALFNTSNLWKLKSDWKVKSSLSYLYDKLESWDESSTTYYFNDNVKTVNESETAKTRKHRLQAQVEAEANKTDYYFRNVLTVENEFANARTTTSGEFPNAQKASLPYLFVNDDLKYIKKSGNRAFTIESHNDFSHFDQTLTVLRAEDDMQHQSIWVVNYNTNTYISSDFIVADGMTIGISTGLEASVRSLDSFLNGVEAPEDTGMSVFDNNHHASFVRPYIKPNMEYHSKNWDIIFSLPIGWSKYRGIDTDHFTYKAFGLIKYMPLPKLSFEVLGSASDLELDIHNMYTGYILRNYRYLKKGSTNSKLNHYYSVTGHINFKDPLNMLYVDGTISKSWNIYQTSATQDFLGNYIILGTEYAPSRGESWYATISGSVGLYGINGKIGASVSYRDYSSTSTLQNGVRTPYRSQTFSFKPMFSGRFAKWLGMEYKLHYFHNILDLSGSGKTDSKDNFSHTLSFDITPINNLDLKIVAEHYFTMLTSEQTKNTVLFDASLVYRLGNGVEINLTARNILNQHVYAYSVINGLQEFSCKYRIRPFNILAGVFFNF